MNTFKVGSKITVTGTTEALAICARDTTRGKEYTVLEVNTPMALIDGYDDVVFIDDVGDRVCLYLDSVTLVEGE